MGKRIAYVGVGAVGGYVAGHLVRAGYDVTLIDPWPEHVEHMRRHGIELSGTTAAERHTVPVTALHLTDVERLVKEQPVDIAFLSVKLYDTEWAAQFIRQYLAPDGFVVSLQNCINEERIENGRNGAGNARARGRRGAALKPTTSTATSRRGGRRSGCPRPPTPR